MLLVGTSGWQYRHWRGRFYPDGLAGARWLEHYAARFATVEVNNTFYRLPPPSTFATWATRVPSTFCFALKVSRYLTHYSRLREPEEPVARFLEHARPLGSRLGPVLVQLPPDLRAEPERLDATLRAFGSRVRVAVEFRHESWFTDEVRALLQAHNAALCLVDRHSRPASPLWRTADWTYLRFHQGLAKPHPCYGAQALATWVTRVRDLFGREPDGYVYFNNDPEGCAMRDAIVFARAAERAGLRASQVPPLDEAPVGDEPRRRIVKTATSSAVRSSTQAETSA